MWYQHMYGEWPFLESLSANLAAEGLHPPAYPWEHFKWFKTFDHAAIRRGFQVYHEVCSTCHSLDRIAWRNLVGVSHTVDEVKAMAADVEYEDGTPATTSQMAKDVVSFLHFTAEPEHDHRKRAGFKAIILLSALFAMSVWTKRFKWAPIMTRKIVYDPPKGHH